jgi:hypothetical protein
VENDLGYVRADNCALCGLTKARTTFVIIMCVGLDEPRMIDDEG